MTNINFVIDGFTDLTEQQIFDMAAAHVLRNGRPSMKLRIPGGTDPTCTYGGIGCAAAPFLRPELRHRVPNLAWSHLALGEYLPKHNYELIRSIQECHDQPAIEISEGIESREFIECFKERMQGVAWKYHLNPSILDKVS